MKQYVKRKEVITFLKLALCKEQYEPYVAYSYRTPVIFYLWIIKKNEIAFFKRSNLKLTTDTNVTICYLKFESNVKAT